MFDYKIAIKEINSFRRNNRKALTNCYFSSNDFVKYSAQDDSIFYSSDHLISIYVNEEEVRRLYFYLDCIENIKCIKEFLDGCPCNKEVVIEYLTKEQNNNNLTSELSQIGISLFDKEYRYRATQISNVLNRKKNAELISSATINDVLEINALLHRVFDPKTAHFSSVNELENLISLGCIYCARIDDKIVGVWLCKFEGKDGLYLYQNAVDPAYQGSGVGIFMLNYAIQKFLDKKTYTAWIKENNKISIRMNEKLGFKRDGLVNYIYLYSRN